MKNIAFNFLDGFDFYHIGYATKSIENDLPFFELLGFFREGDFLRIKNKV